MGGDDHGVMIHGFTARQCQFNARWGPPDLLDRRVGVSGSREVGHHPFHIGVTAAHNGAPLGPVTNGQ